MDYPSESSPEVPLAESNLAGEGGEPQQKKVKPRSCDLLSFSCGKVVPSSCGSLESLVFAFQCLQFCSGVKCRGHGG